jgi:hypothetical protein
VLVYVRRDLCHGLIHSHHELLFNFGFPKFPHFLGFHGIPELMLTSQSFEGTSVGLVQPGLTMLFIFREFLSWFVWLSSWVIESNCLVLFTSSSFALYVDWEVRLRPFCSWLVASSLLDS